MEHYLAELGVFGSFKWILSPRCNLSPALMQHYKPNITANTVRKELFGELRCLSTSRLILASSRREKTDRVTGRYPNISSFKGCAAGEILGISHSVPWATVGYTLRADYFGHKLPTRKNRTVRQHLSKFLMCVRIVVGARGFEPPTSRSQTERTTRLCYAPNLITRRRDPVNRPF